MVDFVLDGLVGKADLEPGTYQLFTLGNASMPSGGPVAGSTFVVAAPTAPTAPVAGAGAPGPSAYDVAVVAGFVGTAAQWLASLVGAPGKDGLYSPANQDEFEATVQAALDGGYTIFCDPKATLTLTRGLHFTVSDRGQQGHGVVGNGMKVVNAIPGAVTYMMDVELPATQNQNRHLHFGGFAFSGYGPSNNNAHGLRFICNGGGWYELVVESNNFEGCADCLTISGNIFEFIVKEQVYINSDRCFVGNQPGGQNVKVLSNCLLDWATYKQCRIGIELDVANSVICRGGSFVDISERSVKVSNGMKNFDNGHFENGGAGYAIEMPAQDWPGTLTNCTLSNTRGGNPYICRYLGAADRLCAGFNRIHVGTSIFTPDSTVSANFTKL